jgi:hypothetical protein
MGNWLAALHECSDILGRPFRDVSHRLLFARAICHEAPKVGHAGDEAFALAIEDCPVPDPGHAVREFRSTPKLRPVASPKQPFSSSDKQTKQQHRPNNHAIGVEQYRHYGYRPNRPNEPKCNRE